MHTAKVQTSRRSGFTTLEAIVSGILLSMLVVTAVPLLMTVAVLRSAADQRQLAAQTVANVMEQLTARSADELTQEAVADVELPKEAAAVLREPDLNIRVAEAERSAGLQRIAIELRWKNRAGDYEAPVRLVSWVSPRGEAE